MEAASLGNVELLLIEKHNSASFVIQFLVACRVPPLQEHPIEHHYSAAGTEHRQTVECRGYPLREKDNNKTVNGRIIKNLDATKKWRQRKDCLKGTEASMDNTSR